MSVLREKLWVQGSALVPNTADRGSVGQMFPKLMTMGGGGWVALRSI